MTVKQRENPYSGVPDTVVESRVENYDRLLAKYAGDLRYEQQVAAWRELRASVVAEVAFRREYPAQHEPLRKDGIWYIGKDLQMDYESVGGEG